MSHYVADGTNGTTAADATDTASLHTLLNEIKGDFNAHLTNTGHVQSDTLNAVTVANATSEATAVALANAIRIAYNAHRVQVASVLNADTTNTVTSTDASTAITY